MEGGGLEDVPASSAQARDTRLARGTFFSESDGYNDQYPFIRLRNLFSGPSRCATFTNQQAEKIALATKLDPCPLQTAVICKRQVRSPPPLKTRRADPVTSVPCGAFAGQPVELRRNG